MSRSTIPAPAHAVGQELHGFRIDAVTEIPDIKALAYEATHLRTGAVLLHVHCNDEENLFSVGFRTPPPDSTGVAHILEHSVLAGSRKYPVRDAFKELGKRTLNTFLNAMTWPDRTVYPVCSAVKADYFNLASVYSDLVFDPLITRQTFQQEGHHLELQGDSLAVSGVVYNEMKGAYSSPEDVVYRQLRRGLLPDTPYGFDSGGDPEVIPDLTYEQFAGFHRRFYSPSNARFLLYGDVPLAENLAFIEGVLAPFERVRVDSRLALQPSWSAPRTLEASYPVGAEDRTDGKSYVCLGWLLNETTDVQQSLALEILTDALVGSSAGPLRKALIDSGLGEDLFPAGFSGDARQAMFLVGLRGTEAGRADQIEGLVLDTLRRAAEEGLDAELIEGSMHQIEFSGKEISPPFPIWVLVRAQAPWYAGGDPKWGLQFSALIDEVRARFSAEPGWFGQLLREWLVDNPHRLRLVVTPSTTLAGEREAAFAGRMAALKASLSPREIERIDEEARALREAQSQGDRPEDLARLPRLAPEDIPREVREVPARTRGVQGVTLFEHELFSNGVGYVGLSFDTRDLDDERAIHLPLLGRLCCGMGAGGLDYEQQSRRVSRFTGGLSAGTLAGRELHGGAPFERFLLDGTALLRHAGKLIEILRDVLLAPDTSDHKRARDLLLEASSQAASRMIPGGSMIALLRAAASLGPQLWRREQWEGASQVRFLKQLARGGDAAPLAARIGELQRRLFTRSRVQVSLAGDAELLDALRPGIEDLLARLPAGEPVSPAAAAPPALARDAGIVLPAEVNYVSQVLPVPGLLDPAAPALNMLSSILASDYLYKKLRVQGGAYGGSAVYLPENGLLALISYRDPHLLQTLEVYRGVAQYVEQSLDDEAVEAARIGAIGKLDRILAPGEQLATARRRALFGITTADRTAYRNALLEMTAARIREQALPILQRALDGAPRAVVAGRERLLEANTRLEAPFELFEIE